MRQLHAFVAADNVCRGDPNSLSHVSARYGGAGLAGFPAGTYIRAHTLTIFSGVTLGGRMAVGRRAK
jgi:hypothetical protein